MTDEMLHRNQVLKSLLAHARHVIADGVVTEEEARTFHEWMGRNPDVEAMRGVRDIARQLNRIFRDGCVTEKEREELLFVLRELTGDSSPVPPEEWGKLDWEGPSKS